MIIDYILIRVNRFLASLRRRISTMELSMPDNDPLQPGPPQSTPPAPQPYRSPDWNPSNRPPFEPPGTSNPADPTRNPWQGPGNV